ncbi:androglobin-like [Elysia marginata]|uniref:Globin n=1 Tax=Elysia marginata TaxID=1093978 RepID=A0AAV4IDS0_9GAST|nr:androglobin-like [Elysia marginata]
MARDAAKKEDKKGKSPTVAVHYFEDPEGKIEMPPSLRVDSWKRPTDFIQDKLPVVVDTDNVPNGFDLIANNEHLHEKNMPDSVAPGDDPTHTWKPWEHIYALCKAGKGPHLPLYNNHGKYVVRLYWMGCWRKIIIDDAIPFDDQGRMLLPATTLQHELWPMLLTKALIKVASLDYAGGNPSQEFGDVTVLQCLTGWIPEAIPLQQGHMKEVWELMKSTLPEWRLPEQEWEKPLDQQESMCKESTPSEGPTKDEKLEKENSNKDVKDGKEKSKDGGKEKSKEGKDKDKGKDEKKDKKDKDKDKEKGSKGKEKEKLQEEKSNVEDFVLPEKPEIVMFATYSSSPKYPVKVSVLGEMNGLSHMYPHPVCITQTRSCPMEPPPPPVVIPAWKLIRPRKKKVPPHDEPIPDPEPPKEIQCLEITSPFVNYKVSPVPIPTDTHRPKSSLERGGARSRADTENPIEEGDENAPTPPPAPVTPEPEPLPVEEPKEEEEPKAKDGAPKRKASGKSTRSKPGSASKERGAGKRPESRQSMKDVKEVSKEILPPGAPPLGSVAPGGLAPPAVQPVLGPDGEPLPLEEEAPPEPPQDNTPKPKKAWMDFDIFCKCFRTLYVFHKSNTYLCNQRYSDLKARDTVVSEDWGVLSQLKTIRENTPSDGSSPFYLFVDNLAPTDIVVSYSVLSRWFDPPVPTMDDKKSLSQIKQSKDKDGEKEATNASISLESVAGEQKPPPPVTPGTLVAEPYSWKSLVTGQPILRLRTTGTKSAVLSLPPGRHVLRFMMTSPLGHHVHMCSTVNFVFGDEETVMPQLTNESCRFRDNATQVITCLGKCILGFSDTEQFQSAWAEFVRSHCPYLDDKQMSKKRHFQTFNEALYSMLKKTIKDIITPEIAFAWRAFTYDATTPNILAIPVGSRPGKVTTFKLYL